MTPNPPFLLNEDHIKYLSLGLSNHSVSKFTVIDIADYSHDEIKEQILENERIVERLKQVIKDNEYDEGAISLCKEILGTKKEDKK